LIEVKWFGGKARFAVPEAGISLEKIKEIIAARQLTAGDQVHSPLIDKQLTPLEKLLRYS